MKEKNIIVKIIEEITDFYNLLGYVTEDKILETTFKYNLPLDVLERVYGAIIDKGIIIKNDNNGENEEQEFDYDKSKIDYDQLFDEIISLNEELTPFIEEIRLIAPPQKREWINLIDKAKNGNQFAKKRIVEMYLKVVINIVYSYHKKLKIPLADGIQDGVIGLIIAIKKFNKDKHDSFNQYAPWWIRRHIIRVAPMLNPLIYIPFHKKEELFNVYDILQECENCYGHKCNKPCSDVLNSISEKLNCSIDEGSIYINILKPFENIEELLDVNENIFSDQGFIEDEIIEKLENYNLKRVLDEIFQDITSREKEVILLRYGFIDGQKKTLEEIGQVIGVTKERIRQIEKKAIKKIAKRLKNYKT